MNAAGERAEGDKSYRTLGNVAEKQLLERLRDLDYLDEELQVRKKGEKKKSS